MPAPTPHRPSVAASFFTQWSLKKIWLQINDWSRQKKICWEAHYTMLATDAVQKYACLLSLMELFNEFNGTYSQLGVRRITA